ncbi:MAG: UPF0175 family protein [Nitrospirota bacterium]
MCRICYNQNSWEQHILLMTALKMFELGKVSSGKAAELVCALGITIYFC